MYYNSDKFELFPDIRDPNTGDWLPLSESDKAHAIRAEEERIQATRNSSAILQMLTSILK